MLRADRDGDEDEDDRHQDARRRGFEWMPHRDGVDPSRRERRLEPEPRPWSPTRAAGRRSPRGPRRRGCSYRSRAPRPVGRFSRVGMLVNATPRTGARNRRSMSPASRPSSDLVTAYCATTRTTSTAGSRAMASWVRSRDGASMSTASATSRAAWMMAGPWVTTWPRLARSWSNRSRDTPSTGDGVDSGTSSSGSISPSASNSGMGLCDPDPTRRSPMLTTSACAPASA